MFAHKDFADFS
jgi:phenylalanine-4-hydroxylase